MNRKQVLFTYFGALIVFLTFLADAVYRVHYQELAASIRSAETVSLLRKDNALLMEQVSSINSALIAREFNPPALEENIQGTTGEIALTLYHSIQWLSQEIRMTPDETHRLGILEETVYAEQELFEAQIAKQSTADVEERLKGLKKQRGGIPTLVYADDLHKAVLLSAEEWRKKVDAYSIVWKVISAGLYVLGWGLGLYGKLHGMGGGGSDATTPS